MDYEKHWGLSESPFRRVGDPRFFYVSPTHQEAFARLNFLVENRRKLGLLLGDEGSGKSLLFQVFAAHLKNTRAQTVTLNLLGSDPQRFLWSTAGQLGLNPGLNDSQFILWRKIVDRIIENRRQQISTVLLLDDASLALSEIYLELLRMIHSDVSPESQLTIILSATPDSVYRLGKRLLDQCDLRIDLDPWDIEDTLEFLKDCLEKVGGSELIFDDQAVARLQALANGSPGKITRLAELSLLAGAGEQLKTIDPQTIDSVYQELSVSGF